MRRNAGGLRSPYGWCHIPARCGPGAGPTGTSPPIPASNPLLNAARPLAERISSLPPEGYVLTFGEVEGREALILAGADARGVLHAAMTAAQLLTPDGQAPRSGARWRRVEAEDWPDVPRRGATQLLDYLFPPSVPFKGFEPGILDARDLVDQLVQLKLNALVLHAADPAWRSQWAASGIDLHAGAFRGPDYWHERLQGLIAYARARGLTVLLQLYHTLDGRGHVRVPECEPCLADPENQALLQQEFKRSLEWYPELDGYVFRLSEFRRCTCPECRGIVPTQEFVTMLRRYQDVLIRAGQVGKHLGFCLFPARHYPDLRACRDLLPPAARHWAWSDWAAGQVGFFLPFEQTAEAALVREFPGSWYWVYTNALTDIAFPWPAFFQDRARAAVTHGLGGLMGQFTCQRAADLNTRALAQYAWHAARPLDAFLEDAVAAVYGERRLEEKLAAVQRYQAAAGDLLRLLWDGETADGWRRFPNTALERRLRTIEAEGQAVVVQVMPLLADATPRERLALRGLLVEAEILALEASARLGLRDAYGAWLADREAMLRTGTGMAGRQAVCWLELILAQYGCSPPCGPTTRCCCGRGGAGWRRWSGCGRVWQPPLTP